MEIHFAPLQGYTDHLYRRYHAQVYGPVDAYYTPFIRMEKGQPRRQDITRLENSVGDGTNLIPQIIFNSFDEFKVLAEAIKGTGYNQIDLNLGCPYPMQANKGRGVSMISDLVTMRNVSEYINGDNAAYSIKMRLGKISPNEWKALMPLLNDTKLSHITVHPRIATQMYGGEIYQNEFRAFFEESKNAVILNGDIMDVRSIDAIYDAYPEIKGIMIGRGLLARPSLANEWRSSIEYSKEVRMDKLMTFHNLLFDAYKATLCGQAQILQKIKPFWDYLEPQIGHKASKMIHKATTLQKYQSAVDSITFSDQ